MAAAEIAIVLALMVVNGFFAMSELAIVSARRVRLQQRADAGSNGAKVALELSDNPTRFLSTVQIGITSIGILAGAYSGATIAEEVAVSLIAAGVSARAAEPLALVLVVVVLTFLSLVIGELVPKRFAQVYADTIASAVAPTIKLIARITHPAVTLLQISTEAVLRLCGVQTEGRQAVTDEEISALLAEGAQQGLIHPVEQKMVEEVMRLADRPVRTIMTRRQDVIWLDVNDAQDEIRSKIADIGYSRFPVCDGGLDDCLGYVRTRALVDQLLRGETLDLRALLREPLTVTPELSALELMARFRKARPHLAVVMDEYGTVLGIVTPADVLETIAGRLAEDLPVAAQATKRADGSWLVDAQIELQDLEHAVGIGGLAMGVKFTTLAALILEQLGRIPETGDVVVVNRWRIEVVDMDGHRIDKVLVSDIPGRSARV